MQGPLAQITWYHNLALLEKLDTPQERLSYAEATAENGRSRNILALQIENALHERGEGRPRKSARHPKALKARTAVPKTVGTAPSCPAHNTPPVPLL